MRDHRMSIRADARAIGAVTATSTRASNRWQSSGTRSGECVSIFPDGTRIPFTPTRRKSDPAITTRRITVNRARLDTMREIAMGKYGNNRDWNEEGI